MKALAILLSIFLYTVEVAGAARSPFECPPRCQCYADPVPGSRAVHLVCKWEQLNTTNLATLRYPDQVRTLTIRCPHHTKTPSRPPDRLFEGLRQLDRLEIDRCIIDRLPAGLFAGMHQLYSLVIKNAKMPDIPQGLFDYIPNLMTLDLSGSDLRMEPYALRSLNSLMHLDLSNNSLNFLANTLGSLTKLRVLSLDHNRLTNIDFRRLPSELTDLSLRGNLITTVHYVGQGGGANTLFRLDLSGNQVDFLSGTGYINVFPPSLKQLDLSHNRISLVQDNALSKMQKMLLLDLSFNSLTDVKESSFVGPTESLKIFLRDNPLRCSCSLQWLLKPKQNISVEDLKHIMCSHLVDESRSVNLVTAAAKNELLCKYSVLCHNATCTCCQETVCDCRSVCPAGCQCYASAMAGEKQHNVLQCRDLRSERLSEVPRGTTALSLSGTRKGWMPSKLGRLDHLHVLNISRTDLAEFSEESLANLPKLRTLDISSNELTALPSSLPSHIHHLLVAGNPLKTIAEADVKLLDRLHSVSLGGNSSSFACDCDSPTPFQKWIRRNRKKVVDLRSVFCDLSSVGKVSIFEVLPGPQSLCETYSTSGETDAKNGIDIYDFEDDDKQQLKSIPTLEGGYSVGDTERTLSPPLPPSTYANSPTGGITPKVVIFDDNIFTTKEKDRTRPLEFTKTPSTRRTTPRPPKRRGRHEPEHHKILNAILFALFICVILLIMSIAFMIYRRFIRRDVEIVRSSSFEAEPLNR